MTAEQQRVAAGEPFGAVYPDVPEGDRDGFRAWYVAEPGVPNLGGRARATAPTSRPRAGSSEAPVLVLAPPTPAPTAASTSLNPSWTGSSKS